MTSTCRHSYAAKSNSACYNALMIAYVLFNTSTPGERAAADFADRLRREQLTVELLDADSPRGIDLAEHYDVLGRPAVLLIHDDGTPVQVWQGDDIPLVTDVAYLAHR